MDVVIEATRQGYRQLLVVKECAAAARVASVPMPVRASRLKLQAGADGAVHFLDSAGKQVGTTGGADMWDSTVDAVSGEHPRRAALGVTLTKGRGMPAGAAGMPAGAVPPGVPVDAAEAALVLTPDAAFLADPATVYPVTIDPVPTLYPTFDTFVQTGYTSDQSGSPELKLGTPDGGGTRARFCRDPYWGQNHYAIYPGHSPGVIN